MLPKDPVILLSFVNTKLRDAYSSLEELCAVMDADPTDICNALALMDFHYDPAHNQFI